ncbi:helix-turn-helix transcriptional regulator [Argonema antarcticum]|uniref:helix-turn-helix transcriptional regulator n=1 Tax=Argonema antarcticum TaxID=2942763 RepID=UPI00201279BD|nr:WYL domain-containing protein [Argonema antarcticum]MCL1475601.1 WYL domain-containing protein [Argonema antarcticum A004/B2]
MAKKPTPHPYSDLLSFDRLMLLIATLIQHPGVGCKEDESPADGHHDALEQVQNSLQQVARDLNIQLPNYSIPTIRKDLETLRRYGILEQRMYRQGYYLGTGVMSRDELRVAFEAIASAAKYQGNPQTRRIYEILSKRLRGLDLELKGQFFYPVRQHLNRAINYTDPEEMMAKGKNRNNLFHQLDAVEQAISQGQAIEISRHSDPYQRGKIGLIQVWPLQLIYYDIAWYIIYEYCSNNHLAIGRVNRFKNYCEIINASGRSLAAQQQSLIKAHKLLENGWGLYLGEFDEQKAELEGKLTLEKIKVRFFPAVIPFILEGERRHPRQKVDPFPKHSPIEDLTHVNYTIELPPRSLKEFSLWVDRHKDNAQVISPPELVEKHRQAALALVDRYS